MALNWTMLNPNRIPVPLPREMTIATVDSGADITLYIPDAPPSAPNAKSGGSGGTRKLQAAGKIWLSDQRFIFVANHSSPFESLSIPLHSILSTRFEQPTFGANYLVLDAKPSAEGGLTNGTRVEVRFKDRAMFEFVSLLEKTRERAIYMSRQSADEEELEGLPTYPAESSTPSGASDVPSDAPPGYEV